MRTPPQARRFADGRLHLQDGPIDLIIEAFGNAREVQAAYSAAALRFATVLDELCAELPLLRAASTPSSAKPDGIVARRMADAVSAFHRERFLTPMAAVAGSVAQEILAAMIRAASLSKAYVNNGGDIALHLSIGASFTIGMIGRLDSLDPFGRAMIAAEDHVRGVATSGWRGRSFSLGIADAVTVLAREAAMADAAATLIANAVDLPGHPAISRTPAADLVPQSDLGRRLVTTGVGRLTAQERSAALARGVEEAEHWRRAGWIEAAALRLGGDTRLVGAGRRRSIETHEKKVRHAVG